MGLPAELLKTFKISLPGGIALSPTYFQAGAVVLFLFLLIFTLGFLKRKQDQMTFKGIMPGFSLGIVTALLVEAILIASGSTVLINVLGWKDAPKPISIALDTGRAKLVNVLGVTSSTEPMNRPTIGNIMSEYQELQESEQDSLRSLICRP